MIDAETWRTLLAPTAEYLRVETGVVAEDRENQQRVLVIGDENEPASECYIGAIDITVAEANPQYPHDDDVFTVVYLEELQTGEVDTQPPQSVAKTVKRLGNWKEYHYPRTRLEPAAPDRVTLADYEPTGGKQ